MWTFYFQNIQQDMHNAVSETVKEQSTSKYSLKAR